MSTFSLTQRAMTDLKSIERFTENRWSREQRHQYIKQFDDTLNVLAGTPEISKKCSYIKENYQKYPHGSYVIFYRIVSHEIFQMIRILHKYMDIRTTFSNL